MRLPEITSIVLRGGSNSILGFYSAGCFIVRPADVTGVRGTLAAGVSTSPVPLFAPVAFSVGTGYRQYLYGTGASHGAWWGSASLSVTPFPSLATTFTYLRQTFTGSSPLLFDGMGEENNVAGSVNLRLTENLSLQHSQTYSFITSVITARVYGISVTVAGGHAFSVSWDETAQKLSASYSFRR